MEVVRHPGSTNVFLLPRGTNVTVTERRKASYKPSFQYPCSFLSLSSRDALKGEGRSPLWGDFGTCCPTWTLLVTALSDQGRHAETEVSMCCYELVVYLADMIFTPQNTGTRNIAFICFMSWLIPLSLYTPRWQEMGFWSFLGETFHSYQGSKRTLVVSWISEHFGDSLECSLGTCHCEYTCYLIFMIHAL